MPLTDEQAEAVKKQILKQVESFPEEKREQIRKYITEMNNQQLEDFMAKNQQMQGESSDNEETKATQCIMCAISNKKIESSPIYEDSEYMVVLELNPLSQGHAILIPKKHISTINELPKTIQTLAKKIAKQLIKKLEAEDFKIESSEELGHAILNIIPLYKNEKLGSRKKAKKEELKELKEKIGEIKIKSVKKSTPKEKKEEIKKLVTEIIKLPRRIP